MIDEIDSSALVQEELRNKDPTLASASSYLSVVTGGGGGKRKRDVKDAGDVPATGMGDKSSLKEAVGVIPLQSAKFMERQRITRITAAESLISDELKKANLSEASLAAFRKAAYEAGGVQEPDLSVEMREEIVQTREELIFPLRVLPIAELAVKGNGRQSKLPEGGVVDTGTVAADEAEMSIDEYDEEQSSSDGSSGSGNSGSDGESVVSRGGRKRTTEESPERELAETTRKSFPGTVTRSDAGCRIYVPPTTPKEDGEESKISGGTAVVGDAVESAATDVKALDAECVEMSAVSGVRMTGGERVETTVASDVAKKVAGNDELIVVEGRNEPLRAIVAGIEAPQVTNAECDVSLPAAARITESANADHGCGVPTATIELRVTNSFDATGSLDAIIRAGSAALDGGSGVSGETPKANEDIRVMSLSSIPEVVHGLRTIVSVSRDEANVLAVPVFVPTGVGRLATGDGWARDARMVEGIFQIMEGMEPPWVTLNILEIAVARYPEVDPETLRLTIMTVIMSQRRCVARLTRAGLRLGPRTDRNGNAFVELDFNFADRYSISH